MKSKYIKIELGGVNKGKKIFVREDDHLEMKKALRSKKTNRIVQAVLNLTLGSPDGLKELVAGFDTFRFISNNKNVKILENFRDLINYRIREIKREDKVLRNSKQKRGKK